MVDAIAVGEPEIDSESPYRAVEKHAAVVGDPGHPIGHEILERQADLARKHHVGELELAELHADPAAEDVGVAKPRILQQRLAVATFLGENDVEVVGDVLAQWSAGQYLDQIGRLEVRRC